MVAIEIPDELAAQASRIPELQERVIRFIKMEVERHDSRQKRFRPDTIDLVARAKLGAEVRRAAGFDRSQVANKLKESWDELAADGGE